MRVNFFCVIIFTSSLVLASLPSEAKSPKNGERKSGPTKILMPDAPLLKDSSLRSTNPNLVADFVIPEQDDGNYHYWNPPSWLRFYSDGTWQLYAKRLQNQEPGYSGGPSRSAGIDYELWERFTNGRCDGRMLYGRASIVLASRVPFRVDVHDPMASGTDQLLKNILPEANCLRHWKWWR